MVETGRRIHESDIRVKHSDEVRKLRTALREAETKTKTARKETAEAKRELATEQRRFDNAKKAANRFFQQVRECAISHREMERLLEACMKHGAHVMPTRLAERVRGILRIVREAEKAGQKEQGAA